MTMHQNLPLSVSLMDRLGSRSSCAGHLAIQEAPALRPRSALATVSAVIAGLAAGMLPVRLLRGFHLDCGKPFDPRRQVIGEHKRAATPLDSAKLARLDRSGDPTYIGAAGDQADDLIPLLRSRKRSEANVAHRLPLEDR